MNGAWGKIDSRKKEVGGGRKGEREKEKDSSWFLHQWRVKESERSDFFIFIHAGLTRIPCIFAIARSGLRALSVRIVLNA